MVQELEAVLAAQPQALITGISGLLQPLYISGQFVRKAPSARTAVPSKQQISHMYALPIRRLEDILSHVLPDVTLSSIEEIKIAHLPRLYALKMSDEKNLVLSYAPSLSVRLLRQESTILSSEATLVNFITEENIRSKKEAAGCWNSKDDGLER